MNKRPLCVRGDISPLHYRNKICLTCVVYIFNCELDSMTLYIYIYFAPTLYQYLIKKQLMRDPSAQSSRQYKTILASHHLRNTY